MNLRAHDRMRHPGERGLRDELRDLRSRAIRGPSPAAIALGALAVGAFAIGALAVGAVAIGRLNIQRARIRRLEIDELVVRHLRVTEQLQMPSKPEPDS